MAIIDLSQFESLDIADSAKDTRVELTRLSTSIIRFESKDTVNKFFLYRIPGQLPVGAKVTLTADTRAISGDKIQIGVDSFTGSDYSSGKVLECKRDGNSSADFNESKISMYVRPGQQYLRVTMGWFSSRIGVADCRGMRIELDGVDAGTIKPQETLPPNYSRYFDVDSLNKHWNGVADGTGSVTRASNGITLTADYASRAYIEPSATNSDTNKERYGLKGIDGSKGFQVSVKATVRSGIPMVFADYFDSNRNLIVSLRGLILTNDNEWGRYYFPPYPQASEASIIVGATTQNACDMDVKAIKIDQYDASIPYRPASLGVVLARVALVGASWVVQDDSEAQGSQQYSSSFVSGVTASANSLVVNLSDGLQGSKMIAIAQVADDSGFGGTYYATTESPTNDNVSIVIYDRSTNTRQDPANLPAGLSLNLTGMSIR